MSSRGTTKERENQTLNKHYYLTLDTETVGGINKPKGFYHIGGIIHDRTGKIKTCFNFIVDEMYAEIENDDYAKKNFHLYQEMRDSGTAVVIPTQEEAIRIINSLLDYYNVKYVMAFNTGFDYCKTKCRELLEGREFIDIFLMACQIYAKRKSYIDFCRNNNYLSKSKKSIATSAESFYAFLTNNSNYQEEHTALEDSKIEMAIFLACLKAHKAFTKNQHYFDYCNRKGGNRWEFSIPAVAK